MSDLLWASRWCFRTISWVISILSRYIDHILNDITMECTVFTTVFDV